jgi:hypothetical protein
VEENSIKMGEQLEKRSMKERLYVVDSFFSEYRFTYFDRYLKDIIDMKTLQDFYKIANQDLYKNEQFSTSRYTHEELDILNKDDKFMITFLYYNAIALGSLNRSVEYSIRNKEKII